MNKGRLLLATSALLLSAGVLAACSGEICFSSGGQTYSYVYTQDRISLDYSIRIKKSTSSLQKCDRWKWTSTELIYRLLKTGLFPRMAWPSKLRKGSNGWLLKGGRIWRSRPRLSQASNTQQTEITSDLLGQKSIKGLDDYVSRKTSDFSTGKGYWWYTVLQPTGKVSGIRDGDLDAG